MFLILSQIIRDIEQPFQTGNVATDLLINLIPHFGVLGVLVWYMHYNVKYLQPEREKQYNEAIKALNAEHSETMRQKNAEHSETIRQINAEHRIEMRELTGKFDANLKEERLFRQQELRELTNAIKELVPK